MITMPGKGYKCDLCSKEFNCSEQLNVHIERQHDGVNNTKKKNFNCNLCGSKFSRGHHLINHMRTHTGERPFECTVHKCGAAFKRQSHLNYHIKSNHSNERPFECDFPGCFRNANTLRNLNRHKKTHIDERPFNCPKEECSFRAKTNSHIARHVTCVHEAKRFSCTECEYKTAQSHHLKRHMIMHKVERSFSCPNEGCNFRAESTCRNAVHIKRVHSEARSFSCTKCEYKAAKSDHLKRHMLVHSARRDFKCNQPQCTAVFKRSSDLKRHLNNQHGEINLHCNRHGCGQYFTTKEAFKKHLELHKPSSGRLQCPLCFDHLSSPDNLRRHCLVHTNEKPFECGHCEFTAASQIYAKRHVSTVHASIEFPFIVHLLNDRECIRCKVVLPVSEFLLHSKGHGGQVVTMI